ncbi:myo-inositol-1(or 4)-monophosphatase [Amycolatopsis sulphurea]|uniref:inositol-phosphate phosphatase n=1 Tax=Amycolatopsis sulphurea TaxID=76022 RepID=A0A2A9FAM1_9PSEU|nr:inositol monophosphatase family protein [Amycolatopsis sulphurea]PFG48467.1 myo-inositol-1(or 4)-monophosphatase [Amycolatopsis sulphurea]
MKNDDLDAMLAVAQEAVEIGRKLMTTQGPGEIRAKGDRDLVTDLDLRIQREVQAFLERATPEIGFLGEEEGCGTINPSTPQVWALDPIDGTSNFAHGIPLCATQLALVHQSKPVVGVVVAPFLDLNYSAVEGAGAYCNGKPIQASTNASLARAIVSLGDYATGTDATEKNRRRFTVTQALAENVERVRMFGSAALDLTFVAEGRTDACVILSNKPWDTAAGVLVAREAGARVTDASGTQHTTVSAETVGASLAIHRALTTVIS